MLNMCLTIGNTWTVSEKSYVSNISKTATILLNHRIPVIQAAMFWNGAYY